MLGACLGTCLGACGDGNTESASRPDETKSAERLLCPNCRARPGGDTGDFPGGAGALSYACLGKPESTREMTLAEARELGFDPDAQLEPAMVTFQAPVRWNDEAQSETVLDITVRPSDTVTLARSQDDPDAEFEPCHPPEYVVPWVEVSVATGDGRVAGSFRASLGPYPDGGRGQPEFAAGGTRLWLSGDASSLGGTLEFDIEPPDDADLFVYLSLLFDRPQVAPRAELSVVLEFHSEDDGMYGEWHIAEPTDGCPFRRIPEEIYVGLDDKPLEFGPPRCGQRNDDGPGSGTRCCALVSYLELPELDELAERCLDGDNAACHELAQTGLLQGTGTDHHELVTQCGAGDEDACVELRSSE